MCFKTEQEEHVTSLKAMINQKELELDSMSENMIEYKKVQL